MGKVTIDSGLGTVLIAGNSQKGKDVIIENYVVDELKKGNGVVILRDSKDSFSKLSTLVPSDKVVCSMDVADTSGEQFNVLAGRSDSEIDKYIIDTFDNYIPIGANRMSYQKYIGLLRNLAKKAGKTVRFDNLAQFSIEDLDNLNMRYCVGNEQYQNDRFLNTVRSDIMNLESYFYDFANNTAGYIFSGTDSLEKIFSSKLVLDVCLDFAVKERESQLVLRGICDAIFRFNASASKVKKLAVIVDKIPNEFMQKCGPFEVMTRNNGDFVATTQDIQDLVEKNNAGWQESSNSIFLFRQSSNANTEYCSKIFGEKREQVQSQTKSWDKSFLGIGYGQRRVGTDTHTEWVRVYKPEEFLNLPDNTAIFYSVQQKAHVRLRLY